MSGVIVLKAELQPHVAPLMFWMALRSVKSSGCGILGSSVSMISKPMCTKSGRKAGSDVAQDQPLRALCDNRRKCNRAVITESIRG